MQRARRAAAPGSTSRGDVEVTTDLWIAIAILALLIALVLLGFRGHRTGGGGSAGSDGGSDSDGGGGGGGD